MTPQRPPGYYLFSVCLIMASTQYYIGPERGIHLDVEFREEGFLRARVEEAG
jgi:hypothetical protein